MMRYLSSTVCALVALACLAGPAGGQAPQAAEAYQTLSLRSSVLGEERVVFVRTPAGYARGEQRYPVLYVTDAPFQFGHTVATVEFLARNRRMPEMIVVGIANTDRTRDLTPARTAKPAAGTPDQFPTSGGADNFLRFIETELIPAVESRYRTQPYRVFAGHSFGGLLAVHAFATRPDLFNAYISVSPSLWWDDEAPVKRTAELLKQRKDLDRALFVTLGNEGEQMRTGFDHLRGVLEKNGQSGLSWETKLMEDEDHGSIVLRSHYDGLRHVFADWRIPTDPQTGAVAGGLKGAEEHYAKLSKKMGYTIPVPEEIVNAIGYQLLAAGKGGEAIEVFKSNVERYPESANVYDSLAEAYERGGRPDLARPNYERAVTIGTQTNDPNLPIYKTNLARVSEKAGAK